MNEHYRTRTFLVVDLTNTDRQIITFATTLCGMSKNIFLSVICKSSQFQNQYYYIHSSLSNSQKHGSFYTINECDRV